MIKRIAHCHCSALELICEGEPAKISMCHCLDCQRRTGSAFSIAVFYERSNINISPSETRVFERESASGFGVKFYFCVTCGANVFWEPARMPHLIAVAAGAFGDPKLECPEQSVWTKDKHQWLQLPEEMKAFEFNPPKRDVSSP